MSTRDGEDAGFTFPCEYRIKAMGYNDADFHEVVLRIVNRHSPNAPATADDVEKRISKTGKYVSVTVAVQARSMDQLDAIYEELTAHDRVLARL